MSGGKAQNIGNDDDVCDDDDDKQNTYMVGCACVPLVSLKV